MQTALNSGHAKHHMKIQADSEEENRQFITNGPNLEN